MSFTQQLYFYEDDRRNYKAKEYLYPSSHIRDEIFLHGLRAYLHHQIFQNYVKLFDENFYVEYSAQNISKILSKSACLRNLFKHFEPVRRFTLNSFQSVLSQMKERNSSGSLACACTSSLHNYEWPWRLIIKVCLPEAVRK